MVEGYKFEATVVRQWILQASLEPVHLHSDKLEVVAVVPYFWVIPAVETAVQEMVTVLKLLSKLEVVIVILD